MTGKGTVMGGLAPNQVLVDECAPQCWAAELDADGRFAVELPVVDDAELGPPRANDDRIAELEHAFRDVYPGIGRRTDVPDPGVVLAEGFAAQLAELNRILVEAAEVIQPAVEAWARAVRESLDRWAPVFAALPAVDPREELLAAKRAPGRTGPPPPPLDGRRSR